MNKHPKTNAVVKEVLKKKPMHRKFLNRSISRLNDQELNEVEKYLEFLEKENITESQVSTSYLIIVDDTFKEEVYFRKNGSYRFSTFDEANEAVYANADYMKKYMIGLALSSFWWSNHMEMRRFFQRQLPRFSNNTGIYREVGPGHGMYFLESLRNCNFNRYEGIDISPTSVEMTKSIINSGFFGSFNDVHISIVEADFFADNGLDYADVMVMGEVLEHVEDPGMFLEQSYKTTTDDVFFFLTTCINAPAIDHLYNPETVENLEKLFLKHGFNAVDKCIIPRDGATLEQCEEESLAINVAYVLRK